MYVETPCSPIIDAGNKLIEEGLIKNIFYFGPIDYFNIWLTKYFAGSSIDDFNNLLKELIKLIKLYNSEIDNMYVTKYINFDIIENTVNLSIHKCIKSKNTDCDMLNDVDCVNIGTCVINDFLDIIRMNITQLIHEYIFKISNIFNLENVRNIDELIDLKVNKNSNLYNFHNYLKLFFKKIYDFLNSLKFNKKITVSSIKKGIIFPEKRIEFINKINDNLMRSITSLDYNRKVVSLTR